METSSAHSDLLILWICHVKMKLRGEHHFLVDEEKKQLSNLLKGGSSIFKTWNKWRLNYVATGTFFFGR